jgi:hypothetical protein
MWLQTKKTGYLYEKPQVVKHKINTINRRVYGKNIDHYIDINPKTSVGNLHPGNKIIYDIWDAALTFDDQLKIIHSHESNLYKAIVIVNWKPFYIKR